MKQYLIPLSGFKVVLVYWGIMFFGAMLLLIQDFISILIGFFLFIFGFHELCHILVLLKKNYGIVGIVILVWPPVGMGFMPDRPIHPRDSSAIYIFSGLASIIVPFLIMYHTFVLGVLFLAGTILLSALDIWNWWQLRTR